MDEAQSRDLQKVPIVCPKLGGTMFEGREGDLQVEDARTGDVEIDGELQQSFVEPNAGRPDLHAAQLA